MQIDNKFKVGSVVKFKDSDRMRFRITQIDTATCCGGTQVFYAGHVLFHERFSSRKEDWLIESTQKKFAEDLLEEIVVQKVEEKPEGGE